MIFAKGKTVLVTGATDGIGKITALELARAGARVLVHGRSLKRAQSTADWILDQTGHRALDVLVADFSSLSQVRRLAEEICDRHADLQLLINNAGVYSPGRVMTEDGNELTYQVNFLAPFLLTLLLEGILKDNKPARVLNVTSTLHIGAKLDFDEIRSQSLPGGYPAYGTSKIALSLFTLELAERWAGSGVEAFHLHPGGVSTKLLHAGFGPGGMSWEEGAETSVFLACAPKVPESSGRYFSRMSMADPDSRVLDRGLRRELWDLSAEMVGIEEAIRALTCRKRPAASA